MAANNESLQSPPLNGQMSNNLRLEIEIPLSLTEHMPQQETTPSPVADDDGSENFLGLFYRVDVEAPEERAKVTNFKMGRVGFSVEDPENATNFRGLLLIMYGNVWKRRILCYTNLLIEQ